MAKVERFEDLHAWQKARELTKVIYSLTKQGDFQRDFALVSQIRSATVSIMSNIAEGYERYSSADFHRFLVIAKASCAEVRSQLYVALDAEYLTTAQFNETMALANETARVLGALCSSVQRRI